MYEEKFRKNTGYYVYQPSSDGYYNCTCNNFANQKIIWWFGMSNIGEKVFIVGHILAYIMALILIVQILKAIFGGTWKVEDIILALLILNITLTFGIGGWLINLNSQINNRISDVDKKLHGHLEWHKAKEAPQAKNTF